jgi:putative flippase GtrA
MLQKIWRAKLTRFVMVGIFNTCFDLSIFNSLVFFLKLPPLVANLISASIGISVSYFLNHYFVFRHKHPPSYARFFYFLTITGIGIVAVQSLSIILVTHLLGEKDNFIVSAVQHLNPSMTAKYVNLNFAKLCAVLIAMWWNFCLYHFIVFKKKDGDEITSITSIV